MSHRATALGLILGLALGLVASATDITVIDRLAEGVAPLGTLFINAIRMVVIPLVVTTVFVGVSRLGSPKAVGKLGGSAFAFFWGTTLPAIAIGMGFMTLSMTLWPVTVEAPTAVESAEALPGLLDLVLSLIPANPFAAAANGALLPLIVFTLLVSAAAGAVEAASAGLYTLRVGSADLAAARACAWLAKPRGMTYQNFFASIEPWTSAGDVAVLRRQMVLGPTPEFCLLSPQQLDLPASMGAVHCRLAPVSGSRFGVSRSV